MEGRGREGEMEHRGEWTAEMEGILRREEQLGGREASGRGRKVGWMERWEGRGKGKLGRKKNRKEGRTVAGK